MLSFKFYLFYDTYVIASVLLFQDKRRIRRTSASLSILKSCNQSPSFSAVCANRIIQTFLARISGRDKSNKDQNQQKFHRLLFREFGEQLNLIPDFWDFYQNLPAHMSLDFIVALFAKMDFLNDHELWNFTHFPSLKI